MKQPEDADPGCVHELLHGVYLVIELLQKVALSGAGFQKPTVFGIHPNIEAQFAAADDALQDLYQALGAIESERERAERVKESAARAMKTHRRVLKKLAKP